MMAIFALHYTLIFLWQLFLLNNSDTWCLRWDFQRDHTVMVQRFSLVPLETVWSTEQWIIMLTRLCIFTKKNTSLAVFGPWKLCWYVRSTNNYGPQFIIHARLHIYSCNCTGALILLTMIYIIKKIKCSLHFTFKK